MIPIYNWIGQLNIHSPVYCNSLILKNDHVIDAISIGYAQDPFNDSIRFFAVFAKLLREILLNGDYAME